MLPGAEVARTPIAFADCLEEVVLAVLHHDHGISARAIRDAFVLLLEVVPVIDIDRICVRALSRCLRGDARGCETQENCYEVCAHSNSLILPVEQENWRHRCYRGADLQGEDGQSLLR